MSEIGSHLENLLQREMAFLQREMDGNATGSVDTFQAWHSLDLQDRDILVDGLDSRPRDVRLARTGGGHGVDVTLSLADTWGMGPVDTAETAMIQAGMLRGGFGQPTEAYQVEMTARGVALTVARTGQTWLATERAPALEALADFVADCWRDMDDEAPVGLQGVA